MDVFARSVREYMSSPVHQIGVDDDLRTADDLLTHHRISALVVVGREGDAVGVLSRRDLLRAGQVRAYGRKVAGLDELPAMCAVDLMSRPVVAVDPGAPVSEACREMVARHIHRVVVLDGGRPVGIFSTRDAMAAVRDARLETPISAVMTVPVVSVDVGSTLAAAVEALQAASVGGLVVTEQDLPVGMFTEVEALEARGRDQGSPVEEAMTPALLCLPARTPLHRAAAFTMSSRARRVLAIEDHHARGVLTGLDFARVAAGSEPEPAVAAAM